MSLVTDMEFCGRMSCLLKLVNRKVEYCLLGEKLFLSAGIYPVNSGVIFHYQDQ